MEMYTVREREKIHEEFFDDLPQIRERLRQLEALEAKYKLAEETLRQSEEKYRLLFQRSPVGVFHYDTDLRITDCNDRLIAILKSSRDQLLGLDVKMLRDQSLLPALNKALEGEEGFYEGFYRATTGSAEIWVSVHTAPFYGQNGEILGGIGIL